MRKQSRSVAAIEAVIGWNLLRVRGNDAAQLRGKAVALPLGLDVATDRELIKKILKRLFRDRFLPKLRAVLQPEPKAWLVVKRAYL
jgi:hypothetical protein